MANTTPNQPRTPFAVTSATPGASPNQQPPPDPKTERWQRLRDSTANYAGYIAARRLSEGDALLGQERERPRLKSVGRRVVAFALNPLEIVDYRRAERLEQQSARAAAAYRQALADFAASWSTDPAKQEDWQLTQMKYFEARVRRLMQQGVQGSQPPLRIGRWSHGAEARFTNFWLNRNKAWRIGIVAVLPAVVGAGLGITAGVLAAPGWLVLGAAVGAGYAGRAIGGRLARSVNYHQAAHQPTLERMEQQAERRNAEFAAIARLRPAGSAPFDVTAAYEQATRQQSAANLRRYRRAQAVGGLAAVAAFTAANGIATAARTAANYSQMHQAASGPAHPSPSPSPSTPTPNTPPTPPPIPHVPPPHGLTHMYPWDAATQWNAAHHMSTSPGSVWHTLHQAAAQYNMTHPGAHFDYILHPNGTFWLENGMQPLNPVQQGNFNTFLWNMSPPV